jgi:AAA15 family ATPase/GTPase
MQIKSVFISNMMSFPYTEDRSKATRFRIEDNDAINVFIGPNGSGKTNFLKIIRQMLTAGIIEDMVYVDNPEEKSKTIWRNQNTNINIKPHFLSPEKPSFARIEISITPNDKENLQFLQRQRVIINNIIQTYSTI